MISKMNSKKGFTLIELMTTVVLIGIIASLAVPKFESGFERIRYSSANRDIISTMKVARSKAISNKAPHGVYFDHDNISMTLFKDIVSPGLYEFNDGDDIIKSDTLTGNIDYLNTNLDNNTIIFMPNGSARFVTSSTNGAEIYTMKHSELMVGTQVHNILAATGRIKSTSNNY